MRTCSPWVFPSAAVFATVCVCVSVIAKLIPLHSVFRQMMKTVGLACLDSWYNVVSPYSLLFSLIFFQFSKLQTSWFKGCLLSPLLFDWKEIVWVKDVGRKCRARNQACWGFVGYSPTDRSIQALLHRCQREHSWSLHQNRRGNTLRKSIFVTFHFCSYLKSIFAVGCKLQEPYYFEHPCC